MTRLKPRCSAMTCMTPMALMIAQCEGDYDHMPRCLHHARVWLGNGHLDAQWHVDHPSDPD